MPGSSAFSPKWMSRNGASKSANMTAHPQVRERFIRFRHADRLQSPFWDMILVDPSQRYDQYDRAIASVCGRRDTAGRGRFLYGGCNRVPHICHDIQEFLCLLLAVNERKNFGMCTCPSSGLNTAYLSQAIPAAHFIYCVMSLLQGALSQGAVLVRASTGTVGPLYSSVGNAI